VVIQTLYGGAYTDLSSLLPSWPHRPFSKVPRHVSHEMVLSSGLAVKLYTASLHLISAQCFCNKCCLMWLRGQCSRICLLHSGKLCSHFLWLCFLLTCIPHRLVVSCFLRVLPQFFSLNAQIMGHSLIIRAMSVVFY
jgi:hypothetical protein